MYFSINDIFVVIRGGEVKTYDRVNGDFAEIQAPPNIDQLIAEKRRQMERERSSFISGTKGVAKKPMLKRNERHINRSVCDGGINK